MFVFGFFQPKRQSYRLVKSFLYHRPSSAPCFSTASPSIERKRNSPKAKKRTKEVESKSGSLLENVEGQFAKNKRGGKRPQRFIDSLNPERLDEVVDVSGVLAPTYRYRNAPMVLIYKFFHSNGTRIRLPFPAGTRGLLYFHSPPHLPAAAGALRFRLCSHVDDFSTGTDLLLPDGAVWDVSLWRLVSHFSAVTDGLIAEGLVARSVLDRCKALMEAGKLRYPPDRVVLHSGQPFTLHLGRDVTLWITDGNAMVHVIMKAKFLGRYTKLPLPNDDVLKRSPILACFEYDKASDDLKIRILKVPEDLWWILEFQEGRMMSLSRHCYLSSSSSIQLGSDADQSFDIKANGKTLAQALMTRVAQADKT